MNVCRWRKQKDNLFEVVLNTISDGVTVLDKDLRIQFQNRVVTQMYGSSVVGNHCYVAYRGRKELCEECKVIDVLKDGQERRIIRPVSSPDGGVRLFELKAAAIKDTEGNIIGAVEIARDVTEQKKAEALLNKTLLKQNKHLKQLNDELSDATGYIKTVLPQRITSGALRTDWRFIPSSSLAGDSFGYHWIDEDHFAIYLLDVSGHGWAAALLSVSVINVIRSHALPDTDFRKPHQVLFALNNTFPSEKHNDMFFTIWYGVYNMHSHELAYAGGGHPPALLLCGCNSQPAKTCQLQTPNLIMGGKQDVRYQSSVQKIQRPSLLYVFSDGVYDIARADGSNWRLNEFITFCTQAFSIERPNLETILRYARELGQKETFNDDFTILEIGFGLE